jgi:hypothetical protein
MTDIEAWTTSVQVSMKIINYMTKLYSYMPSANCKRARRQSDMIDCGVCMYVVAPVTSIVPGRKIISDMSQTALANVLLRLLGL